MPRAMMTSGHSDASWATVVRSIRRVTHVPLDVHLMITDPDRYIEAFAEAGAAMMSVHVEVLPHLHRTVHAIKDLGVKAGVALPRLVEAFGAGCIVSQNMTFTKRMPATLFRGDFAARFALALAHKDFGLAADLARAHNVPTRLLDLCQQRHIRLDHVSILVLDEADRMLDMGFIHDVRKIVALCRRERQTLLLSATNTFISGRTPQRCPACHRTPAPMFIPTAVSDTLVVIPKIVALALTRRNPRPPSTYGMTF